MTETAAASATPQHGLEFLLVPEGTDDPQMYCCGCEHFFKRSDPAMRLRDPTTCGIRCPACVDYNICGKCVKKHGSMPGEFYLRVAVEMEFEKAVAAAVTDATVNEDKLFQDYVWNFVAALDFDNNRVRRVMWRTLHARMTNVSWGKNTCAEHIAAAGGVDAADLALAKVELVALICNIAIERAKQRKPPKDLFGDQGDNSDASDVEATSDTTNLWAVGPDEVGGVSAAAERELVDSEARVSDEPCLICHEPAVNPVHLSCQCQFRCCARCLIRWLRQPDENNGSRGASATTEPLVNKYANPHPGDADEAAAAAAATAEQQRSCPLCRRADVSVLTENNIDLSDVKYIEGRDLARRAAALHFSEEEGKPCLKRAIDAFTDSIYANGNNPKPYLGMAYVGLLILDYKIAAPYIKLVLDMPVEQSLGSLQLARELWSQVPDEYKSI